MQIISPAFENNAILPIKYTCDGEKISPALEFTDVPHGARSLALIMDDPDAPSGDFVHWVIFNLPPDTIKIAEGQTPNGIIGINSININHYAPPCPPSGQHRYQFKLYALDILLNLGSTATKQEVLQAAGGHILAEAQLVGLYSR